MMNLALSLAMYAATSTVSPQETTFKAAATAFDNLADFATNSDGLLYFKGFDREMSVLELLPNDGSSQSHNFMQPCSSALKKLASETAKVDEAAASNAISNALRSYFPSTMNMSASNVDVKIAKDSI